MSKSLHDSSFSLSRRYFNWKNNLKHSEIPDYIQQHQEYQIEQDSINKPDNNNNQPFNLRTALSAIARFRPTPHRSRHGSRVVGTLFGQRRGHVYFAIQEDPKQSPTFLIEVSMTTSVLVREMASGLVRMALECKKKAERKKSCLLVEEEVWRAYCNGKKCGNASRREMGAEEGRILKAVEPITMGAGVLPAAEGEFLYMRGRFERVVGSKDSEAYYMISPDSNGGPELSVYLLRV